MSARDTVFFICLHGSAKSLIAMEYFNQFARERGLQLSARSAGTEPDPEIPAEVVAGLAGDGFDVADRVPLQVSRQLLASARTAISFGPDIAALLPGGVGLEHWDDLPAVSDDYAIARTEIRARVEALTARLHDAFLSNNDRKTA